MHVYSGLHKKNVSWIRRATQGKGMRFHSVSFNLFIGVAFMWNICTTPPQTVVGGRVCPLKILCLPHPRFSFPYPMQTRGYEVKMWNMSETKDVKSVNGQDVKHNHMYDVRWWKLPDFPSTAKAEKQMREITRLFHVMFAVYFREGESECRRVVFDVFGVDVRLFNTCLMFVLKKYIYIYCICLCA